MLEVVGHTCSLVETQPQTKWGGGTVNPERRFAYRIRVAMAF